MEIQDSRRLTGPNLVQDAPGAVLEVTFSDADAAVVDGWRDEMHLIFRRLDLCDPELRVKRQQRGAWLVATAGVDQLYAVTEVMEMAWSRAVSIARGISIPESPDISGLMTALEEEANPRLIALARLAEAERVTFLWDDEEVSLGTGRGSQTWPSRALPDPDTMDWSRFDDVPTAVITGTNGKSTNVRLISEMAACADIPYGSTSTDWIRVNDDILDTGDYSGPGGARKVLRDRRVGIAILETARGGLLRRGAGVNRADVALVTNVADDHMGQYGIQTVEELAEAKLIVHRTVVAGGLLILNADDEILVRASGALPVMDVGWFSLDPSHPLLVKNRKDGGIACTVEDGTICYYERGARYPVVPVVDVPVTLGGVARYNVANCLSATATAFRLGIPASAIRQGLKSFTSDADSNPGRGNYFEAGSIRILLDYAHNVHGLEAILSTTAMLGASRRIMTLSTAGDRTEEEIRSLARAAASSDVEQILVSDCVGYERELGPGGVPDLLMDELRLCQQGARVLGTELDAVRHAFDIARSGDLLILLVKAQRKECLDVIRKEMMHRR